MKLVALIASERKNGNSEISAKYIAKKLNAELKILRLTKYKIEPCKACYACLFGKECEIEDDVYSILDEIEKGDAILISSPVYFLDATSKFKALLDRGFLALQRLDSFSKKNCVILTFHGFKEAKGWASATHLILARTFCFNVLANIEIRAALPGEAFTDENLKKLDLAVEVLKTGKKFVAKNQCPICLNTAFRIENGRIVCALCNSEFDRDMNLIKEGKWFIDLNWIREHFFKELVELKNEFKRKKDELKKLIEKYCSVES